MPSLFFLVENYVIIFNENEFSTDVYMKLCVKLIHHVTWACVFKTKLCSRGALPGSIFAA